MNRPAAPAQLGILCPACLLALASLGAQPESTARTAPGVTPAPPPTTTETTTEAAPETTSEEPGERRSAENAAADDEMTPELNETITRGMSWLVSQQQDDGSWMGGRFGKNVAITALACLALMADGNAPGRGEHGAAVDKGLEFILANVSESGLIAAEASNGPMYGHGFATLFLGEVYGMTKGGPDEARARKTHDALIRAVRLIEQTQNDEGGWRYNPVPYDADTSVTICQIMALRSARNAGLEVSSDVIDNAVEYVRDCQNADGGFRYQAQSGASAWPRSAAGIASLFYAGIYEDEAIDSGLAYLHRTAKPGVAAHQNRAHYFYGQYYAVQANYLAGGDWWAEWWQAIRKELIEDQHEEGWWESTSVGPSYGTAMALIVLQMPKRYLPIFQK